jgi:hypothetical protein
MKTSLNYFIIKDEEEIAKFGRFNLTFPQKGVELITESQTYSGGLIGKYFDEEGKEVFSINYERISILLIPKEIFVDVNPEFDVHFAIIIGAIAYFYKYENG